MTISLFTIISLYKNPFLVLLCLMMIIGFMCMIFFFMTMDYWTIFALYLCFVVGLFLLFAYLISLSTTKFNKTSNINIFMFITILCLNCSMIVNDTDEKAMMSSNQSSKYENMYSSGSDVIFVSMIFFLFLMVILAWFWKKMCYNFKSSF